MPAEVSQSLQLLSGWRKVPEGQEVQAEGEREQVAHEGSHAPHFWMPPSTYW